MKMAVSNSLQRTSQKRLGIGSYLTGDAVKQRINQVIGGKDGQRFISAVVSAVQTNPGLQECTNQSILSAALLGESLKLSPSPQLGQYYMVPFNDRERGKVAQFQLGYKGYIQLAIRSGQYKKLNVLAIKEGELVKFDPLNEEIEVKLIEDEEQRESAETIGYYAMFEYTNGFRKAIYWSRKKMLAHADKYSQAFSKDGGTVKTRYREKKKVSYADFLAGNYDPKDAWMYSSFWYKDFDGMAYKTMLRQLISKWGIMSIDMQSAIDADMAVINEDGTKDYVDNDPDVITVEPIEKAEPEATEEAAEDVEAALFAADGEHGKDA
jgi:recombination protein RecT